MPQGFDRTKPEFQSGVSSETLRTQLNALASCNEGPSEPIDKFNGMLWLDTLTPGNWKLKQYTPKGWEILFEHLNAPSGYPSAKGQSYSLEFIQSTASLVWNIAHNLDKRVCSLDIITNDYVLIHDDDYLVTYIDNNNLRVNFETAQAGKAYIS
jgi:hypothetical protein